MRALRGGAHRRRRAEADELLAEPPPSLVLERVYGELRAPEALADLARAHSDHEAQYDHLALVLRQGPQRLAKRVEPLRRNVLPTGGRFVDLLAGDQALRAHVVDRCVAGDPRDPGAEWRLARLIALEPDR